MIYYIGWTLVLFSPFIIAALLMKFIDWSRDYELY